MNWTDLADIFPPKPISISPLLCHIPVRIFVLYIINLIILARVTNHEVSHYVVFSAYLVYHNVFLANSQSIFFIVLVSKYSYELGSDL
jgi:hypothetical protein